MRSLCDPLHPGLLELADVLDFGAAAVPVVDVLLNPALVWRTVPHAQHVMRYPNWFVPFDERAAASCTHTWGLQAATYCGVQLPELSFGVMW